MSTSIFPTLLALAALAAPLRAQQTLEAAPPSMELVFGHDSGPVANNTGLAQVVISFPVNVHSTPWMRLFFSRIELAGDPDAGTGSILRLTSIYDAEVQELDARGVARWSNTSAYFNGDTVLVEVLAQPGTGANRIVLDRVTAGKSMQGTDFVCGADPRVASFDGRGARLLPPGCTAWMISDCATCFLSAGHCAAPNMIAQFNVPPSQANGNLVHPPIEDQFWIDSASVQSQSTGPGQDWMYLGAGVNNLGETPMQHQLARWGTMGPPPFSNQDVTRVTGYGTDIGADNQIQQTLLGNWINLFANYSLFSNYVEGGNSGSPLIHESNGRAIGIVTHTSCIGGAQQNYATRLDQPNLVAALANPQGVCVAAVCNAVGSGYCPTGPLMSVIAGTGSASVAANDLVLHANNVPSNKLGLFLYSRGKQSLPFGNSRLCVGGGGFPVRRLPTVNSGAGTTLTFALDQNALPGGDVFNAGEVIYFQAWFRVSTIANETSNGLELLFGA
ncbi:MAG TPA: hypothetical protein VK843_21605 [Planctomycetota bacterium]|nr:hypothetical protein [Planctomycetota bacterium]